MRRCEPTHNRPLAQGGQVPEALQLGSQAIGWRRWDLDAWLNERPAV